MAFSSEASASTSAVSAESAPSAESVASVLNAVLLTLTFLSTGFVAMSNFGALYFLMRRETGLLETTQMVRTLLKG